MSEKAKKILEVIIDYYNNNKLMPSIRYLMDKVNIKSTSTIHYHLNKLEEKGYLKRNKLNKRVLSKNYNKIENELQIINVINDKDTIKIIIDDNKDYIAFKIKDNLLEKKGIIKDDILIIEKTNKLKNNDLGLFKINNKYYVMKYFYQDGFYILESDIKRFYNKIKIIGKVIYLERKIKRDISPF